MPLPLLIAGAAVILGGYGVKKGFDAKNDYNRAENYNNEAKQIYDDAVKALNISRDNANKSLTHLGELKYSLGSKDFKKFHEVWLSISKKYPKELEDFLNGRGNTNIKTLSKEVLKKINQNKLETSDLISGGVAALGSGGVVGLAAYGGVGLLGTATTGTAIGSLGGVAATNATLAWLGGGSLASGGLGVAGGTAVLGGIVLGPVLAVGGMILASKAEEAKEKAKENREKARLASKEMKLAETQAKAIETSCDIISSTIKRLLPEFQKSILNTLTSNKDNVRESAMIMLGYFEVLHSIYSTGALNNDGTANKEIVSYAQSMQKNLLGNFS